MRSLGLSSVLGELKRSVINLDIVFVFPNISKDGPGNIPALVKARASLTGVLF